MIIVNVFKCGCTEEQEDKIKTLIKKCSQHKKLGYLHPKWHTGIITRSYQK